MKTIAIIFMLFPILGGSLSNPVIIRHDKEDQAYIEFAKKLKATSAVAKYNATDVAGTLVERNWILSAAHVAETIKPEQKLLLGNDSLEIEKVVIHPGWLEDGRPEDIALIKLQSPVINVKPLGIYKNQDEAGQKVIIIGNGDFGTGVTGPQGNDGRFRAATNLVDQASGEYLIWAFDDPLKHPDKVTRLEGISGPGDSGGPALIKVNDGYLIAGISSGQSTSATGGREGLYGVTEYYTRVSTYSNWIEETIAGQ